MQNVKQDQLIFDKSQLTEQFKKGCKTRDDFKIGLEYEKLPVSFGSNIARRYSEPAGIKDFLCQYSNIDQWDYIEDGQDLIGLLRPEKSLTLEPGSQFEISIAPEYEIHAINKIISDHNKNTSSLAEDMGFGWIGYGVQPVSTYADIELIPKKRYSFMTNYLPSKGKEALVMMRESAGMQVAVDYESEEDAMQKMQLALKASPLISAMFSNSPIRGAKDTGYKSYRAYAWLHTDESRCGLISRQLIENGSMGFGFDDYASYLLNMPMIFIQKDDRIIEMKGMTFDDYLKNGYEGYRATVEDWNLHMSLFFPEARLKNFIELRNCDCQRADMIMALPALWKGLLYNSTAMCDALELLKPIGWKDVSDLRQQAPKFGLDTSVKGIGLADYARELVEIADKSLRSMDLNEEIYLEPLKELVAQSKTPADIILEKWNNDWGKDVSKLVEYTRLV